MGCWGIRMVSRCMGHLNIWGVSRCPQTYGVSSQCLERSDFKQFLLWEGVVVMKELILNSFYFGRVWWSWKNWFWTVSTLGGCRGRCGGLERTDFEQFLLWDGVVVLKELILNSFYFWRCGGLERTDFEQLLLWEGVVVLKELILNSFYFGKVWWSWNNIWEMHWEALRTYKGVFQHMGVLGASGDIRGCPNAWGHPNIWGCQDAPKHMGVSTQCPQV